MLAAGFSVAHTADACGRNFRTVHRWLHDPEFLAQVDACRPSLAAMFRRVATRALHLVGGKLDGDDADVLDSTSLRDLVGAASLMAQRSVDCDRGVAADTAVPLTPEEVDRARAMLLPTRH